MALEASIGAYVGALIQEVEQVAQRAPARLPVSTIFFGGGTPSLLPLRDMERILEVLRLHFDLQPDLEITLEANPEDLTYGYLQGLREVGVNRLSIGMQAAHPEELSILGRNHTHQDVVTAVAWAHQSGLENLNIDLLYGIPNQSLDHWQGTVKLALALNPRHLSLYGLTLEAGTLMDHWCRRGLIVPPDPDLAAGMYGWAEECLNLEGYRQYELNHWALVDEKGTHWACQHQLQYWRNGPYLGFGAGAQGFAAGTRTTNVRHPMVYIQRCRGGRAGRYPLGPAIETALEVDRKMEMQETMLMGLHLVEEGISKPEFRRRFGLQMEAVFSQEIKELVESGLLEWAGEREDRLRLTPKGRLLGNQVFMQFV